MSFMLDVMDAFANVLPLLETLLVVGLALWGANYLLILRHGGLGNEKLFSRQLVMLGLTLVGVVAVVLALCLKNDGDGQSEEVKTFYAFLSGLTENNFPFAVVALVLTPQAGRFARP